MYETVGHVPCTQWVVTAAAHEVAVAGAVVGAAAGDTTGAFALCMVYWHDVHGLLARGDCLLRAGAHAPRPWAARITATATVSGDGISLALGSSGETTAGEGARVHPAPSSRGCG